MPSNKEHLELTTPEVAQALVYRLKTVHGLSGSGLLTEARKILKTEMANLEASGKVK